MRIFKTRWFRKWAQKAGLTDAALVAAVAEIERGLIDADLGGYMIKKRVALPGRGKRSSTRALLVYQAGNKAFFVHGFAKNERDNIGSKELDALKRLAVDLLGHTPAGLCKMLENCELFEVNDNVQTA